MYLHANDIRRIRGDIRDLVIGNNITFVLPRAPKPVKSQPDPKLPQHIDYISLIGAK